jgi:cyclase
MASPRKAEAVEKIRLIARLDVKAPSLVKGIQLEGLRKLGDPGAFARRYYADGIDEILYMDVVASLYGRNSLLDIVRRTTEAVFIPITVGGGLRSANDAQAALKAGADKIAVNTAAIKDRTLIGEVAGRFGSQCMVLSIEAKRRDGGEGWEAYYDNGREHSGLDAVEWAAEGERLGAGEILLTSVDREGMRRGMDEELIAAVCGAVRVPVIACGGCASAQHALGAARAGASAVAIAGLLHYGGATVPQLKWEITQAGGRVRPCG